MLILSSFLEVSEVSIRYKKIKILLFLHLYERIFSLSGKSFDLNVNYFQLPAFPISIPIINLVPRSHSV